MLYVLLYSYRKIESSFTSVHVHHVQYSLPDVASAVEDSIIIGSALLSGLEEANHILRSVEVPPGQFRLQEESAKSVLIN